MYTFFDLWRCSRTPLEEDLQRVPHVSRRDAIQDINVVSNGTERIPLVLKYHPFQQSRQKDLADELQHSDERQNGQGDFPSDLFNILLTRPEYSRYSCAHLHEKPVWVSGRHIPLWRPQMSYVRSCVSHHHHRWTTTQHHHKGAFRLQVQQCCLLHFMSSLPGPIHWGNRAHAQLTHW